MPQVSKPSALKLRKTPRQSRSAETVSSILEAAAQVLETAGFEGYNTNAVARRAGVSIGSLYQYFPTKDALTLALMRREDERFMAGAAVALDEPSGQAAMAALIALCVRQQLGRPVLARLLDVQESRPEFRDQVDDFGVVERVLIEIIRRGDMPKQARPDVAAGDLHAMIRGMVDAAGERKESGAEDLQRRVQAAVFGYLSRTAISR